MATTIESLFGINPEALQAQRDAALQQQALQFAQLDPRQAAQAGFYMAGNRLGGGIAGLLGAQDPELERVKQRQSLVQGIDPTNPQSLREAALQAQATGDYAAAMELVNRAAAVEQSMATLSKTQAEAAKAGREKAAADPVQKLIETGKYTPQSVAKYKQTGEISDLQAVDKADPTAIVDTEEGVFLVNKLTGQQIARLGSATKKGTTVSVGLPPQPKAEQEERGKLLVRQYGDVSKQAVVASKSLPALEAQLTVLDKGFDTGFGTETKAAAARLLGALGVEDAAKFAADAQSFLGMASQAVLTRQLEQKGPQTEADAQRITQTGAQLGNTKAANRFLINVAKAQFKRDLAQRAFYDKWFKANKTYDGAEDAWFEGEGGKSIFTMPELRNYGQTSAAAASIPATGPTPSVLSPQDQQALAWANANPNDPRAAQIKAKLGK